MVQGIENGSSSLLDSRGELHAYYHTDYLGTTDYLTSAVNSKVIAWTSYNEWGEITHNAVLKCGQRELDLVKEYATHDYDAVLDLYYAKARFYDAYNRTFTAQDPILDPSQYDLREYVKEPMALVQYLVQYLYVRDNAVNRVDILGLISTVYVDSKPVPVVEQGHYIYVPIRKIVMAYGGDDLERVSTQNNRTVYYDSTMRQGKYEYNVRFTTVINGMPQKELWIRGNGNSKTVDPSQITNIDGTNYVNISYFRDFMCNNFNYRKGLSITAYSGQRWENWESILVDNITFRLWEIPENISEEKALEQLQTIVYQEAAELQRELAIYHNAFPWTKEYQTVAPLFEDPMFNDPSDDSMLEIISKGLTSGIHSGLNYVVLEETLFPTKQLPDSPYKQTRFPVDPDDFNPEGLTKTTMTTKNGRIIKWLDKNKKAVYEWDEDFANGSHYHILDSTGKNRVPVDGNTHIQPGTIIPER